MFVENKSSLVVPYPILVAQDPALAYFVPEAPLEMLRIFDRVQGFSILLSTE